MGGRALAATDRTILVVAPDTTPVPTERQLAALMDSVTRSSAHGLCRQRDHEPLLDRGPARAHRRHDGEPEISVTEWRQPERRARRAQAHRLQAGRDPAGGRSPGGTSLRAQLALRYAQTASAAVAVGGVGRLERVRPGQAAVRAGGERGHLGRRPERERRRLRVTARRGDAVPARLPVHDPAAARQRGVGGLHPAPPSAMREPRRQPRGRHRDTLERGDDANHVRERPFAAATFDPLSLDRALAIYRERFADAATSPSTWSGAFDPDSIRPYVERTGALPSTAAQGDVARRGRAPAGGRGAAHGAPRRGAQEPHLHRLQRPRRGRPRNSWLLRPGRRAGDPLRSGCARRWRTYA